MSTVIATGRHRLDVTPAPAVVRRSLGRRLLRVSGKVLGNLLMLVCLAVFLLIAVGPHVFGYRTATMLTGSMDPGITPGDVVVTMPKPASEVKVGDVVSYQIPVEDHRVETHRVVKVIHRADGAIAIQTKGDANEARDPWTATIEGDTVWQMKAVVPQLGNVIHLLRSPAIQHGGFWVALAGLILLGLSSIWRKPPPDGSSPKQSA
ncbi:signal peptidase I [Nocardioides sp. CN2-186]|uniref:signal peptidase I n=1 Tax=Nocardioides tweenelious TaxID=3156607 RepID=UPI0032B5BF33